MHPDQYKYLIGALLLYQVYASILVALSKYLDNEQKLKYIAIAWALPLLGAIYVRSALNAAEREARQKERAAGVQEPGANGASRRVQGPDAQ